MTELRMTIDPLDFTPVVALPYLVVFVLMLRRFFRKDGSGNRRQEEDPFAPRALAMAAIALAVPIVLYFLRFLYIFIPYGTLIFGALGLAWLGYAFWLQRRPPPPPVKSKVVRPPRQNKATARRREGDDTRPARRARPQHEARDADA
jgi:hypothetical protein